MIMLEIYSFAFVSRTFYCEFILTQKYSDIKGFERFHTIHTIPSQWLTKRKTGDPFCGSDLLILFQIEFGGGFREVVVDEQSVFAKAERRPIGEKLGRFAYGEV